MNRELIYITAFFMTVFLSCRKVYTPTLVTVSTNILAVDGPIISGDSTFIKLSRTTSLTDTTQNKAELKAVVFVENDQNNIYPLTEKGKGLYVLGVTNFNPNRKYRLNVKTSNGKIYQSDYVPMKNTPPIDSVYFETKDDNHIIFYLDAHDATNSARYYRWDYKETWRYVSLYKYEYAYNNGVVSYRNGNNYEDVSTCYRVAASNEIFVGSTINQTNDVITHQQLGGLTDDEKITRGYVLQVKQYALTKEGFEYYQNLRTSTEKLGSLFDPQASFLKGNIHCVSNPAESVVGFISVSTATTKQVNLSYAQIPITTVNYYGYIEWLKDHFYNSYTPFKPEPYNCPAKAVTVPASSTFQVEADALLRRGFLIFDASFTSGSPVYFYTSKECVDCRLQGGTTTKPSYFPFL